jgi:hypothetical protein
LADCTTSSIRWVKRTACSKSGVVCLCPPVRLTRLTYCGSNELDHERLMSRRWHDSTDPDSTRQPDQSLLFLRTKEGVGEAKVPIPTGGLGNESPRRLGVMDDSLDDNRDDSFAPHDAHITPIRPLHRLFMPSARSLAVWGSRVRVPLAPLCDESRHRLHRVP